MIFLIQIDLQRGPTTEFDLQRGPKTKFDLQRGPLENSKVEFKGSVIISIRLLVKASSLHFLKGIDKFSF